MTLSTITYEHIGTTPALEISVDDWLERFRRTLARILCKKSILNFEVKSGILFHFEARRTDFQPLLDGQVLLSEQSSTFIITYINLN